MLFVAEGGNHSQSLQQHTCLEGVSPFYNQKCEVTCPQSHRQCVQFPDCHFTCDLITACLERDQPNS